MPGAVRPVPNRLFRVKAQDTAVPVRSNTTSPAEAGSAAGHGRRAAAPAPRRGAPRVAALLAPARDRAPGRARRLPARPARPAWRRRTPRRPARHRPAAAGRRPGRRPGSAAVSGVPSLRQRRAQLLEGQVAAGGRRDLLQPPRQRALVQVADAGGAELAERAGQFRLHHALRRPRCGAPFGAAKAARAPGSAKSGPATAARSAAKPRLTSVPKRASCSAGAISSSKGRPGLRVCSANRPRASSGTAAGPVGAGRCGGAGAGREEHRFRRALVRVEDQAGAAAAEARRGTAG